MVLQQGPIIQVVQDYSPRKTLVQGTKCPSIHFDNRLLGQMNLVQLFQHLLNISESYPTGLHYYANTLILPHPQVAFV